MVRHGFRADITDSGLGASTAYYYRVVAVNPVGDSTPSSVATATTQADVSAHTSGRTTRQRTTAARTTA